ncbi:hypothetical protein COO60DRAFT_1151434 [Scenedesmus sp. NREL 46B-D3]|nr:hypothetical protein COO60DRAFT_1151434 [Scenedesmus sp. NREL 46B-D3]
MSQVWRISLSNLSRNLLEATELANVLQEVSSSIQVTGLSSSLSGRLSTSTSATPTKLSARERIRSAVPIIIGAGAVPWEQLVGVVSSDDALLDAGDTADAAADRQPQMLQVNTGGAVFFLFFKLNRKQQHHYHQQLLLLQPASSRNTMATIGAQVAGEQIVAADAGAAAAWGGAAAPVQQQQQQQKKSQYPREGIAVLKVGFNRLAMQAEQFANELTRHLGIAAPDCRIVRQVGPTADEWTAALGAVHCLASCCCGRSPSNTPTTCPGSTSSSYGGAGGPAANSAVGSIQTQMLSDAAAAAAAAAGAADRSEGAPGGGAGAAGPRCSSCGGCLPAAGLAGQQAAGAGGGGGDCGSSGSGTSELLGELSHLPCFLLMEYVEGDKLSDSPQALQGCAVGRLLEDVGCLFLLDMLLGNADRMPCADLGWRGNAHNLLYGAPGTRHESRPVAIDSCVARRPPALKASAEDAAVERLAQLLLSVPDVSRSLLQQLLGNIKGSRGQCSRLSIDDAPDSGVVGSQAVAQRAVCGSRLGGAGSSTGCVAAAAAAGDGGSCGAGSGEGPSPGVLRGGSVAISGNAAGTAGELLALSDADIARFQAGLKKCLTGVLQIKGLLEMVSTKIAEWMAEFVADVVRLNPALLPSPAGGGPAAPGGGLAAGGGLLRSPRPSPRASLRSMHMQGACSSGGGSATPQQQQQQQQQQSACVPLPPPAFAAGGVGVNASTGSKDRSGNSGSSSSSMPSAAPAGAAAGDVSTLPGSAGGSSPAAAGVPLPAVHLKSSRSNNSSRSPSPGPASKAAGAVTHHAAAAAAATAAGSGPASSAECSIPLSPGRNSSSSSSSSSATGAESPSPRCLADSTAALANDAPSPGGDPPGSGGHNQSGGFKFFRRLGSPASRAPPLARRWAMGPRDGPEDGDCTHAMRASSKLLLWPCICCHCYRLLLVHVPRQ